MYSFPYSENNIFSALYIETNISNYSSLKGKALKYFLIVCLRKILSFSTPKLYPFGLITNYFLSI